ncbi:hypothetical protein NA57DRAFT_68653 [Rhizodiscina lignyota]|uniref:Dihydrolipoamide acetyltransferase component of pyruvate dehydrogenase complex n=1 Tax=Rhizodiscina lignyota TaxID=1504668 RepID=A0A9P4M2H2_9PEZI|nr:hypothetical protein NA57DRAFT_68653 [Rhizodiscina lignyota]
MLLVGTKVSHFPSRGVIHGRRQHIPRATFATTRRLDVVKPFLLADIGEGITECQIIQWFVAPGARVEQFDKICEVQSDKASVEITSRFDGIIKKLYYEKDDVAKVGKPLLDIDIQGEIGPEDEAVVAGGEEQPQEKTDKKTTIEEVQVKSETISKHDEGKATIQEQDSSAVGQRGKAATLATPAVRRITKELNVEITDVQGTGKDGRVLKEDVQKFALARQEQGQPSAQAAAAPIPQAIGEDKVMSLTAVQSAMFKTMTRSLSIPHFLYTDTVDFSSLNILRKKANARTTASQQPQAKLSALPFIIKAVSIALSEHPHLNAHLDTSDPSKPKMNHRASHNIGIAVDSPSGLLVPVIRNVQSHSIASIAAEIVRLSTLAQSGKLAPKDFEGATFTVSNVGSIGGGVVSPVIVSPQVAILGVGRARAVPAFGEAGEVVRREECIFSWAADHRVVDGAGVARCADRVRGLLEGLEEMLVNMR